MLPQLPHHRHVGKASTEPRFDRAGSLLRLIAQKPVQEDTWNGRDDAFLLNVNVNNLTLDQITGMDITSAGASTTESCAGRGHGPPETVRDCPQPPGDGRHRRRHRHEHHQSEPHPHYTSAPIHIQPTAAAKGGSLLGKSQ